MQTSQAQSFSTLSEKVGTFNLRDKTILLPEIGEMSTAMMGAALRSFGVRARVLETCRGLDLGKEHTSGKECYPCQVTLGDLLHFMNREKAKKGKRFDPENYLYLLPEAEGPCRFGMYNKYQRLVLDTFPDLERLKITSLSAVDIYRFDGLLDSDKVQDLRMTVYFSILMADILDRLLWRIRPYEKLTGMSDRFIEKAKQQMIDAIERHGEKRDNEKILAVLDDVLREGKEIIDPQKSTKPLIAVTGEIYMRSHVGANQDLIRKLEEHGAEVINASMAEWVNYCTYDALREAKIAFRLNLKQGRIKKTLTQFKKVCCRGAELCYQQHKQKQVFKRVRKLIDIAGEHRSAQLEKVYRNNDVFSFDMRSEASLSIAAIILHEADGVDGVVNVYPLGCMPGTTTTAVAKSLCRDLDLPYLDAPFDENIQSGRETQISTFMYQAQQHFRKHGRKKGKL